MAKSRLFRGTVKMGIALPQAFSDWTNPSITELNGPLSFDLTPALVEAGTKFDLGDSTEQSYLAFNAPTTTHLLTFYQPQVIYEFNRSTNPTAADQANAAFQLLQFPGVEYFAWVRIGKDPGLPFSPGDKVSIVRVATDWPVENVSSGRNLTMIQTFLPQGDLKWQYTLKDPTVLVIQDNLDGTYSGFGPIVDNGDGTYSTTSPAVTDNGSGVLTAT